MKLAIKIGLVVLVILLAFPLANLFIQRDVPEPDPATLAQNPEFSEVSAILSEKCADCHTTFAEYPWYAKLPPAKSMVEEDIEKGREALDLTGSLTAEYGDMSPVGMAKVESVIRSGHMPPFRYVLLHWDNALDETEQNALADWIREHRAENRALSEASREFLGEPVAPIPAPEALDQNKVALGDRLFHDGRLSGDDTVSCASCHDLAKGGTDQVKTSTGINGQTGGINSPTVYNSTFSFVQFWDGRAKDLQEQAAGPVANPIEMGSEWPNVVEKLKEIPEYQVMFDQIYEDGITKENVTDAIATFEKTLVTPNSRFDKYLKGDRSALTEEEIQGYQVFKENGCTSCHFGVNLGGTHYEKMGKHADYFEGRDLTDADQGRFNVTKDEKDRFKFKVPTLRNIAQTAPYFHDGITQDLSEAVRIMSEKQLREPLTDEQIRQVARFLRAQTGEYKGKSLE